MSKIGLIRLILIIAALSLILVPLIIVSITDQGFGELTSQILVSSSILCAISAIMLHSGKKNKDVIFAKCCVSIGLLSVLISLWF